MSDGRAEGRVGTRANGKPFVRVAGDRLVHARVDRDNFAAAVLNGFAKAGEIP